MQNDFYKNLLDNLSESVYFVDRDKRITYWNKAAEVLTGRYSPEVLGLRCADNILVHTDDQGNHLCLDGCPLTATMADGKFHQASAYMLHKRGHRVPIMIKVMPIRNEEGQIIGGVETFNDNSTTVQLKEQLAGLEKLSLIDELTRAGNRRYANITLDARLNEFKRYGWPCGVIMFDIDDFKKINDTYGHETGDEVLKMISRSISGNIRSPASLFFRWGGEEFVVMAANVTGQQLFAISERMRTLVSDSMLVSSQHQVRVTVSAGATVARPGDTPETIMRRADELLYVSKKNGKNRSTSDSTNTN